MTGLFRPVPTLPEWLASHDAVEAGTASPLQRFIAAYEPASAELRDAFRSELAAVLAAVFTAS